MKRMRRLWNGRKLAARVATLLATTALAACAASPPENHPQEYLDKETAATISVVDKPLVFARERPERAAHARDYATVAAAAVNRQGKTDYVLIAYFWSTLDPHDEVRSAGDRRKQESEDDVTFIADDRVIKLPLAGHSATDAGVGVPVHAPAHASAPDVYRTDLATLRYMAAARHLALLRRSDADSRYELWDDHREALAGLVRRQLSGEN